MSLRNLAPYYEGSDPLTLSSETPRQQTTDVSYCLIGTSATHTPPVSPSEIMCRIVGSQDRKHSPGTTILLLRQMGLRRVPDRGILWAPLRCGYTG